MPSQAEIEPYPPQSAPPAFQLSHQTTERYEDQPIMTLSRSEHFANMGMGDLYEQQRPTRDFSAQLHPRSDGTFVFAYEMQCDYERLNAILPFSASHSDILVSNAALAVIDRIRELGTYPAGWNRPDTVAPSIAAINDAVQFVQNQDFASIHLPSIGAADDGEINFWWDVDGLYIDLGFFGDGSYSFYARLPNGKEITVDQAPVSQPLPAEILQFLKKSD